MFLAQYMQIFKPYADVGLLKKTGRPRGFECQIVKVEFDSAPSVGTKINFQPDETIHHITCIRAVTTNQLASITESGSTKTLPSADGYKDAILHLVGYDNEIKASVPLNTLTSAANRGKPAYFDTPVCWHKSYIQFTGNTASITTSNVFVLQVWTAKF